jgi:cytochrome c oxidase subunit 2
MNKPFQALAVAFAVFLSATGFRASDRSAPEPRRVEIVAKRFAFEPNVVTLKKGEPVSLVIKSYDVEHGLILPDLGLNLTLRKHGSGELNFTPREDGDFVGNCSVFCGVGHGAMTLTFHIVD